MMIKRLLFNTDRKCLWKFIYNFGFRGIRSFNRFQRRRKNDDLFPAFHHISVTDDCNLNCQGCWVTGKTSKNRMEPEMLDRIITETKKRGSYFFGILGGEPLMYRPLFDVLKKHKDCYFQLFTNGTLLTAEIAEAIRKLSNVTPLISFEGDEAVADTRRGGTEIYRKTMEAVKNSAGAGLVTGVAVSICKSNLDMALSGDFINLLIDSGVIYIWYYIFRPAGANPSMELCLSGEEIQKLRAFMVDARSRYDVIMIDTYWDDMGKGLCPAAAGLSHHINAAGYVEPCPVIQFSDSNVYDNTLTGIYKNSVLLKKLRHELPGKTTGCIFLEDPQWLSAFVTGVGAVETSGRHNEAERLLKAPGLPSHASAKPVPEKSWVYRFAKRSAFLGLGSYG